MYKNHKICDFGRNNNYVDVNVYSFLSTMMAKMSLNFKNNY